MQSYRFGTSLWLGVLCGFSLQHTLISRASLSALWGNIPGFTYVGSISSMHENLYEGQHFNSSRVCSLYLSPIKRQGIWFCLNNFWKITLLNERYSNNECHLFSRYSSVASCPKISKLSSVHRRTTEVCRRWQLQVSMKCCDWL